MLQAASLTPSWLWVAGAFLGGCFVGWYLAVKLGRSAIKFALSPARGEKPSLVTIMTRTLELKCECGAVHKFREGAASTEADFKPYPKGDSYICPICGRATDLKQIRELAQ